MEWLGYFFNYFWLWIALLVLVVVYLQVRRQTHLKQLRTFELPKGVRSRFVAQHPQLSSAQITQVKEALGDFFECCYKANKRPVSMPSQVVDDLWHHFILFTKAYSDFSTRAFGRYLHHTPVEAMRTPTQASEGLKRTWRLSCLKEGIDPTTPTKLPLLFAIDKLLDIPNGFYYSLDCSKGTPGNYCAGGVGCSSGCASCGSGDGGSGDGGSGCGGD